MRGLHSMVNPIPDGCLMLPLLEPACGLRVRVKASLLSWSSSWPTLPRRSLLNGVTLAPSRGSVGSLECCGHFLLPAPPPSEAEREGVAGISSLGDTEMLMGEGADGAPLIPKPKHQSALAGLAKDSTKHWLPLQIGFRSGGMGRLYSSFGTQIRWKTPQFPAR